MPPNPSASRPRFRLGGRTEPRDPCLRPAKSLWSAYAGAYGRRGPPRWLTAHSRTQRVSRLYLKPHMANTAKVGAKRSKDDAPHVVHARASEQKPLPLGPGARMNARVVFALILVALALWTASSFLPSLIWATILAVALWPLYQTFAKRLMGGPSGAAAFVFTVLVALILITPISLAVYEV